MLRRYKPAFLANFCSHRNSGATCAFQKSCYFLELQDVAVNFWKIRTSRLDGPDKLAKYTFFTMLFPSYPWNFWSNQPELLAKVLKRNFRLIWPAFWRNWFVDCCLNSWIKSSLSCFWSLRLNCATQNAVHQTYTTSNIGCSNLIWYCCLVSDSLAPSKCADYSPASPSCFGCLVWFRRKLRQGQIWNFLECRTPKISRSHRPNWRPSLTNLNFSA